MRFDNRGVGRSSGETAGVSIAMMADDAARLLDHLGIDRAHVIGVSMGGMITQELALRHPQRLITQTLCCTSPRPAKKRVRLGDVAAMLRTIATEKMAPILLSPEFQAASADKVRDFEARVASIKVPKRIILRQMKAAFRFDVTHRLQEIRVPTLVMTGDRDILIDHGHSDLLARSIQGAMLKKFPGAGHGFIVERYGEVLLTEPSGAPVLGAVDLEVNFFRVDAQGSPLLAVPLSFGGVVLSEGVFQLVLDARSHRWRRLDKAGTATCRRRSRRAARSRGSRAWT